MAAEHSKKRQTTGEYSSEFEYDSEAERKRQKRHDLAYKPIVKQLDRPKRTEFVEEWNRDEARYMRHHSISTNAYAKHKQLVNDYIQYYGGQWKDFTENTIRKNDHDIIRENHQFVWSDDDEAESWDRNLAKRYYDKLFKEYCVADLSRYKENKIGLRWRTEKEVIIGKGQFICGNKKCESEDTLKSWEVNFAYIEKEVKKNELVKLRLCPKCSEKLNFKTMRKEVIPKKVRSERADGSEAQTSSKSTKSSRHQRGNIDDVVNELLV